MLSWIKDFFVNLWQDTVDFVVEVFWTAVDWLMLFATNQIPQELRDWLTELNLDPFVHYYDFISYVIPLTQTLTLITTAYAVVGGIRLARWIIKLCPWIG